MESSPTASDASTPRPAYPRARGGSGSVPSSARFERMQGTPHSSRSQRGRLAKTFENKFGTEALHSGTWVKPEAAQRAQRGKGLGNYNAAGSFTDPTNPSNRKLAKQILAPEVWRDDARRAGARTRNPGLIPQEHGDCCMPGERARSEDGSHHVVPLRYSTSSDWRPGKRVPDHVPAGTISCPQLQQFQQSARSPRCSEGVTATFLNQASADTWSKPMQPSRQLENYLNDMKKSGASRRTATSVPSASYQKMSNARVKLPSERRAEKAEQGLTRSASCDGRVHEESDRTTTYGFAKKRGVGGSWTQPVGFSMLHHAELFESRFEPVSPPRSARGRSADATQSQRFKDVVAHMHAAIPNQRMEFELIKARSEGGLGIFGREGG